MQPQLIAGRYQVLRAIGRGGMGTVWLCRDEVLGREVAVKQIGALPGESATETKRAMREARSAAALNHPNAVAVYDVVKHDDRPWLVMEYVEGQTLADEIAQEGKLSPQRVADVGAQLAGALARAHERGIVHRDIKPGNVLIDKAGRPKISDFGIARGHGDEQLTQIGFITGTPGYLSPELARGGDPHSASDVWALGATLYAAVEGQSPYAPRSNPIALLRAIATERPRPMTHAGVLAPAIDAMMHEDPDRRWDMATSAKRLVRIAHITAVMPRVDLAGTTVTTPPLEPTQALAPTQRLKVATPVLPAPVVVAPVPAAPVVAAPVVATPVVATPKIASRVAAPPVVPAPVDVAPLPAAPVVVAPVVAPSKIASRVAPPPVVPAPVVAARVAEKPVAAAPVAETRVAEKRVVAAPANAAPMAETPAVAMPVVPAPVAATPVVPLHEQWSRRRWLPLALVALLAAVLGVVYLSQLSDQGASTAGTTARITPAKPRATSPSKVSEPPRATRAAPGGVTAAPVSKLESFVKSYYADVTRDTGLTWGQLTPTMQRAAGGRGGYDGFWKTIARVQVNRTQANAAANTSVVNLTFTRNDGSTSTETHRFTFVVDGGSYLIDSDKFLG